MELFGLTNLALGNLDHPDRVEDSFQKIKNLSNQLLSLINDILEISKMEQGKLEIRNQKFNIRTNTEELVSIYQAQIVGKKKQFDVQIYVLDEWVNSDWNRIRQILDNLLSNAFKFTKTDGRTWLTITEQKDNNSKYGKYRIVVKDNGAGRVRNSSIESTFRLSVRRNSVQQTLQGPAWGCRLSMI